MKANALVTLTPEESKRLVAKAIANLDEVKTARKHGIIGFAMCTTAGFVAEEVLGKPFDLRNYSCGFVHNNGMCLTHPNQNTRELVMVRGDPRWLPWPTEDISTIIDQMGASDIIIKSGNILGNDGKSGVLVGCPNGGEIGKYLPYIYSSGIQLIVPMTLNKSLHVNIDEISRRMGVKKLDKSRSYGMTVGMIPLPGKVITEIEALEILCAVKAIAVSAGGYTPGAGAVSILIEGDKPNVEEAWELVYALKREPRLEARFGECRDCVKIHSEYGIRCNTRRFAAQTS